MKEKTGNKREWVKTAAIVFLSVMLLLTFFSNTIMNYSLPQVASQYIQSGTITAKVRGTGVVESGSLYNVKVAESRKVTGVEVKTGDRVEIGDVILTLEDKESEELKTAREALKEAEKALEEAKLSYDTALLAADLSMAVRQNGGSTASIAGYREQIIAAQNEVNAAQNAVNDWQKQADALNVQITITPANTADTSQETQNYNNAKAASDSAAIALTAAKNRLTEVTARYDYALSISSGDAAALEQEKLIAENNVINAQAAADAAALKMQQAEAALSNKQASGDTSGKLAGLKQQLAIIQVNLDAAQKTLEEKKAAIATLTGDIGAALNLDALSSAIADARETVEEQQETVEELESKAIGATVTADVAGTITSISIVAGESTSPDTPVAVIQPEGKGFTLSFSVTAEQAKRISAGDPAELVNSWWYNDITATVASIKPDPADPAKKRLITFDLSGELTAGQSLSLQVGEKSQNYDMIVPNSAIREDNNGKFILVVETRNSPLGNRYYAVRYDVEVLASDDIQSAISGGLYGYEYVITTSTKPIEAGQMVRLPD